MRYHVCMTFSLLLLIAFNSIAQDGWTNQTPSSTYPALIGIQALDAEDIWAVGSEGTVLHSTDGGDQWDLVSTGYDYDFTTVVFLNRDTGFISGHEVDGDAYVLRTYDRGSNWQFILMPVAVTCSVNDIDFFHASSSQSATLYAVGGLGHAWKSENMGDNWTKLGGGCGNGNFNACSFIDENKGWLVGTPSASSDFSIMITSNGGDDFYEQINPTQIKLNDVSFVNASKGIAVGLAETMLYTENGGEDWENRPNEGYRWQSVHLDASGKAWAVGDQGRIAYSTDFGYTWSMQESGVDYELWEVSFVDEQEGWVVGGGIGNPGIILHTTNGGEGGGTTGLEPVPARDLHGSLDQNYPNPFTHSTQISYHIQHPDVVTLTLYDMLGNKLQILLHEFQQQGEHTVDLVNDRYPGGAYFYELKIGSEVVQTRKMMILQ